MTSGALQRIDDTSWRRASVKTSVDRVDHPSINTGVQGSTRILPRRRPTDDHQPRCVARSRTVLELVPTLVLTAPLRTGTGTRL